MNKIAERVRATVNESDHPSDFVAAARTACVEIDLLESKLDGIKKVLAGADDREWSVALLQVAEIVGFEVPK